MEPNNLQDLQDLIISTDCPDTEDKAWSIPVQILIDQYESSKYNDALCLGNFSFVLQSEDAQNVSQASVQEIETPRKDTKKSKNQKSRGTSTLHFCESCGKEFGSKTLFIRHLKSHSGSQPFVCSECNKAFKHSWLMDKHIKLKHEPVPSTSTALSGDHKAKGGTVHQCKICHKSFPYWNTYLNHTKMHQGIKDFACTRDGCRKTFRTVSQLNDHVRGHDGAFVCKLCSKAYRSRSALKFHIQKHNEEPKRIFCDFCQKLFDSEKALKMHKRCHSKQPNSPACLGEKYDSNNATKNRIQFSICSEKIGKEMWYRCRSCQNVRSRDKSTVEAHVCLSHGLEIVTEKIISEDYNKIE